MPEVKLKKPIRQYYGDGFRISTTVRTNLAQDFHNRCGYCDDSGILVKQAFHIDHFAPKSIFPELKNRYENMVYSCPYCNQSKSNKWAGNTASENIFEGKGFCDPCSDDYSNHLKRSENGEMYAISGVGRYMFIELKLYLKRHSIIYRIELLEEAIVRLQKHIENECSDEKKNDLTQILNQARIEAYNYYHLFHYEEL